MLVVKKILLPMHEIQEMQIGSLGQKDPLEKEMATHCSILAWEIPWTEEPSGPWGCIESNTAEGLSTHIYVHICIKYVCVYIWILKVKVLGAQSCPTLWNPMDCSSPGSSVHGILQARILEWVAIPFCRVSSQPRDWTQVSHISGRLFTIWVTRESLYMNIYIDIDIYTFSDSFPL